MFRFRHGDDVGLSHVDDDGRHLVDEPDDGGRDDGLDLGGDDELDHDGVVHSRRRWWFGLAPTVASMWDSGPMTVASNV